MGKYTFGKSLIVSVSMAFIFVFVVFTIAIPCHAVASSIGSVHGNSRMSAVVMGDGTVWAWGNGNPTPEHVAGLTGIKSVNPQFYGDYIALGDDGTVWVWYYGSPVTQVRGLADVKKVVTLGNGPDTGFALKNDGTVWGFISRGSVYEPVQVQGLASVKDFTRNTILKDDGTVWTWGIPPVESTSLDRYDDGKILQINGLENVDSLLYDGLVVKNDGTIWEWGYDDANLGFGGGNLTPWQFPISNVKKISGGGGFFVALKDDGTVWAWGTNYYGELGDSVQMFTRDNMPVQIKGLSNVKDIGAGAFTAIALKSDGTVWAWGDGEGGQLGVDAFTSGFLGRSATPLQVPGLDSVSSVYMSDYTCFALRDDGSLWAWGANNHGQVGDGALPEHPEISQGNHYKPAKVLIESSPVQTPTPTVTASVTVTPTAGLNTSMSPNSTAAMPSSPVSPSSSPSAQDSGPGILSILGNGWIDAFLVVAGFIVVAGGAAYLFMFRKK